MWGRRSAHSDRHTQQELGRGRASGSVSEEAKEGAAARTKHPFLAHYYQCCPDMDLLRPKLPCLLVLLLISGALCAHSARSRSPEKQNNAFRKAAAGFYQTMSNIFGEDNVRAVQKFFSRLTERFVYGVDVLMDTLWRIWTDLLDILGIDASNLTHYFSPVAVASNPTRVLMLLVAVFLAYCFASLFLGFFFYILHFIFGRFFSVVRVILFALSCVYILQKYEGEPEHAMIPLCFVVAIYFMTGPVGLYWRRSSNNNLEEKIDHLDNQIRLLNIRLTRVIESLDRAGEQ